MKEIKMTDDLKSRLKANLFHAAHDAVGFDDSFSWHKDSSNTVDSWKKHSSQALAIDVFGTIKQPEHRDILMDAIAKELGLQGGGPWTVELEWSDPDKHLKESPQWPTQVDVMAQNSHNLIFFECKFTEVDGGSCSQPRPLNNGQKKGKRQCNGNYEDQVNPANGKRSKCALTGKGIRYWEVIPQVLNCDPAANLSPCPFKGSWFQWMRNLTVCSEVARKKSLKPAFVLVYADGDGLHMAKKVKLPDWKEFTDCVKKDGIVFRVFSYQTIIQQLQGSISKNKDAQDLLRKLGEWVEKKIQTVQEKSNSQ